MRSVPRLLIPTWISNEEMSVSPLIDTAASAGDDVCCATMVSVKRSAVTRCRCNTRLAPLYCKRCNSENWNACVTHSPDYAQRTIVDHSERKIKQFTRISSALT